MNELCQRLECGGFDTQFACLYGARKDEQPPRYVRLLDRFEARFGAREGAAFFSAPGRTEIGGNHTDHNHGRVLAGAVDLDVIAVAAPWDEPYVCLLSEGHEENRVELSDLTARERAEEENPRSNALLRGVLAGFRQSGAPIGGFCACTASDILAGSGLSSSAAFEILLCTMLDSLFGRGDMPPLAKAQVSQRAENLFFHKPCGLMDQTVCAAGNLLLIDFADPEHPEVTPLGAVQGDGVPGTFLGLHLCVTAPGGSHAGLTDAYAAVSGEMQAVARALGARHLRDVDERTLSRRLPALRAQCGDRSVLRALHFFAENERVLGQADALKRGARDEFLRLVRDSGRSSFMYLQNVYAPEDPARQALSLALCLSERLLGDRGAWRVHGGGFAGTIQAFVPDELLGAYRAELDGVFGKGACRPLSVRSAGGVNLA